MSIDKNKLKLYLENNLNVMLIGKHGTGKTTICKEVLDEGVENWQYFSGSTLDPWVDFCGVPFERNGKLTLVRPENFQEDKVEAIFIDEYNRAHSKIKNAVMELIQFKSINGRKFKNLRVVWCAINPDDDEDMNYDVESLDPAQKDRFHIHINVPYEVSEPYFIQKYGEEGKKACNWWMSLPDEQKDKVSPRRLDYAIDIWKRSGDLRDVLHESTNVTELISILSVQDIQDMLNHFIKSNKKDDAELWINASNNYELSLNYILKSNKYKTFFLPLIDREQLSTLVTEKYDVLKWVTQNSFSEKRFSETIEHLMKYGDSSLRKNLWKESESAIPPFKDCGKINEIGRNVYVVNFTNTNMSTNSIDEISKQINSGKTAEKCDGIKKLFAIMTKNLDEDLCDSIMSLLELFCSNSINKTVEIVKVEFIKIFNEVMRRKLTSTDNLQNTYTEVFDKYPNIYKRIYSLDLFQHCDDQGLLSPF